MKSMIEYEFNLSHNEIDLRNLSYLDLTCADFSIFANFSDKSNQDQAIQILSQVSERY